MAVSSVLIALALIFSYIETIIPFNFGIPGMKLGLPNLVVVVALYGINARYAFGINCIRILLASAMFGNLAMAFYSLAGALLSFAIMFLLKRTNQFSVMGVSIAGGVFHNIGQLMMAMVIVENMKMAFYLPLLLIFGVITGLLIGVIGSKIIPSFQKFQTIQ